jgi:hypothetical protein
MPRVPLAILVVFVTATSAAIAGARPSALPPPGVRSSPAWFTVTTGPTTASEREPPQLFALTARSNADALTPLGVFDGLKKLSASGALIWAITDRKGAFLRPFKRAVWPPQLADFRLDHAWEGQPLPRIQQRLLALMTHGWSLEVRVYFGTQRPSKLLLASVQAELNRLTLP